MIFARCWIILNPSPLLQLVHNDRRAARRLWRWIHRLAPELQTGSGWRRRRREGWWVGKHYRHWPLVPLSRSLENQAQNNDGKAKCWNQDLIQVWFTWTLQLDISWGWTERLWGLIKTFTFPWIPDHELYLYHIIVFVLFPWTNKV